MNSLSQQTQDFFGNSGDGNSLEGYIKSLSPEAIAQLSRPEDNVAKLMERNILGALGTLPGQAFGVTVTTSRESLAQLLASAMVHGYFLRNAEQRMTLEQALPTASADPDQA
jgi:hypothetical protein